MWRNRRARRTHPRRAASSVRGGAAGMSHVRTTAALTSRRSRTRSSDGPCGCRMNGSLACCRRSPTRRNGRGTIGASQRRSVASDRATMTLQAPRAASSILRRPGMPKWRRRPQPHRSQQGRRVQIRCSRTWAERLCRRRDPANARRRRRPFRSRAIVQSPTRHRSRAGCVQATVGRHVRSPRHISHRRLLRCRGRAPNP